MLEDGISVCNTNHRRNIATVMSMAHGWKINARIQPSWDGETHLGTYRQDSPTPSDGIGVPPNPKPQVRTMMLPPHTSIQAIIVTYFCRPLILSASARRYSAATRHRNRWVHRQAFWNKQHPHILQNSGSNVGVLGFNQIQITRSTLPIRHWARHSWTGYSEKILCYVQLVYRAT